MIKVLKYGKKKVTCPHCESVLLYDKEDVNRYDRIANSFLVRVEYRGIQCPVCLEIVEVCDD